MRIISGHHRGLKLETPTGNTVRPTADRVRENVFNIVQHRFAGQEYPLLSESTFLDLCCGTGAVGLEAASRGAREVLLVDNNDEAARIVAKNSKRFVSGVRFMRADVMALPRCSRPFDYVFMDPPYTDFLVLPALKAIVKQGYINAQTLVILEQDKKTDIASQLGDLFSILDDRCYGHSRVYFLKSSA